MGLFDFLKKKEPVQPEVQQPSSAPVNPISTYPVNFNDQQPVAPVEPTVPTQAPVDNSVNPVISNIGACLLYTSVCYRWNQFKTIFCISLDYIPFSLSLIHI